MRAWRIISRQNSSTAPHARTHEPVRVGGSLAERARGPRHGAGARGPRRWRAGGRTVDGPRTVNVNLLDKEEHLRLGRGLAELPKHQAKLAKIHVAAAIPVELPEDGLEALPLLFRDHVAVPRLDILVFGILTKRRRRAGRRLHEQIGAPQRNMGSASLIAHAKVVESRCVSLVDR